MNSHSDRLKYRLKSSAASANLPLHLVISEKLRDQIARGEFLPGEQLPSEHQLMLTYAVSRITVRRAIANLVSQGLVVSHRGKGVFVKERRKLTRSLSNPLIFFDEDMAQQQAAASIQTLAFEVLPASPEVAARLHLSAANAPVYCQKKVILVDQVPVAIDITYILLQLGQTFATELQSSLIYPTLDKNGVLIERVEALLECTHATHEISTHLETPLGAPLLVNRYVAYTTGDKPVICGETLSRADRLCYSVILTKRATANAE
ncbi:MAG: GntR family transcriptional regulator [Synechococcales cyanobacterium M58_A2018_015]|nr:GntR family transcriptional regulator [Synechococcales cyanobacterium M58_A2018_015]